MSTRTKTLALVGLTIGVVAITAGFGYARAGFGPSMRGHGPHGMNPEVMRDRAEFMVDRALKYVDATEAQRAEIEAILEQSFQEGLAMREDHGDMHQEIHALLTADTIDRAALEAMRVDKLAKAEQMSLMITRSIADVAEVLTPEQRLKLADFAERRMR